MVTPSFGILTWELVKEMAVKIKILICIKEIEENKIESAILDMLLKIMCKFGWILLECLRKSSGLETSDANDDG